MKKSTIFLSPRLKGFGGFWIVALTFSMVIIHCGDDASKNTMYNPRQMSIDISIQQPTGNNRDPLVFFIGEEVSVNVATLFPEVIDTVTIGYIVNLEDSLNIPDAKTWLNARTILKNIDTANLFTFKFDKPDTIVIVARAASSTEFKTATATIRVVERKGTNKAPEILLEPFRRYAAATLPCSLRVINKNPEPWQTVKLSSGDSIVTKGDSFCVWIPKKDDTGGMHDLSITATDNGDPVQSFTAHAAIALLTNDTLLTAPKNLRITELSSKFVKIAWDGDSLADRYEVIRSSAATSDAETTFVTTTPSFTDSISEAFYYRIAAVNFFGSSKESRTIISSDPIHYSHAIQFKNDVTTVPESAGDCYIALQVSELAKKDIVVNVAIQEKGATSADYTLPSNKITIKKGSDTASLKLSITDDDIVESPETLVISIESVSSGFVAGITKHTVVIMDNDTFYTVTYNANGATGGNAPVDSKKYRPRNSVTIASNSGGLVKKGCTFIGWSAAANGGGRIYTSGDTVQAGGDMSLYAVWSSNPVFTVTYRGNGNSGGDAPVDSGAYEVGVVITLPGSGTLVNKGFTFTGWNTKSDGKGTNFGGGASYTFGNHSDTLFAQWEANKYTVTYNGNGADVDGVPPTTTYLYNAKVKIPVDAPMRKGYTFFRWNTTVTNDGVDYLPGDELTVGDANITLYARWIVNKYTVSYNGNNLTGGAVPEPATVNYAADVKIASKGNLIRTGYIFSGWNTMASGDGVFYPADTIVAMGARNMELFAVWKAAQCKVVFDSRGGTPVTTELTVNYNSPIVPPATPTKSGYTFTSWHRDSLCATAAWDFSNDIVVENITLYAKWSANSYKVVFDARGGTPAKTEITVSFGNVLPVPPKPVKTGYSVSGWYKDSLYTNSWDVGNEKVTNSIILYAKWVINQYTVTYNGNGNSNGMLPSAPINYNYGQTIVIMPNSGKLVKNAMSFIGWNTQADGNGTGFACGANLTMGTDNIVLYAKYSDAMVMDNDGNVYTTVKIGSQVWLVENLKTTRYDDGTSINQITDNTAWQQLTTPAYCWYGNDDGNKRTYGALYNKFTVNTARLAPAGWHIPSDAEWTTLQDYLIANGYNFDSTTVGNKIAKALASKTNWSTTSTAGAPGMDIAKNNTSGFTAVPGGYRNSSYSALGTYGYWWTTNSVMRLYFNGVSLDHTTDNNNVGFSVRCLRDY